MGTKERLSGQGQRGTLNMIVANTTAVVQMNRETENNEYVFSCTDYGLTISLVLMTHSIHIGRCVVVNLTKADIHPT